MNNTNNTSLNRNLQELKLLNSDYIDYNEILIGKLQYNNEGQCINAFEVLSEAESLRLSYNSLKSKPGNMVPGTDNQTFDRLSIG